MQLQGALPTESSCRRGVRVLAAVAALALLAAACGGGSSDDASVPIERSENPTDDLIAASGRFSSCLDDLGVKFIGRPDPSNPQSPTNDPDYLEALGTCAQRSNIIQVLEAAAADQETWSATKIQEQNEGYLLWRTCMVDRGWKIAKPSPDAKGRLFQFSVNSDPPIPPPGQDFFNSKDQEECTAHAQREYEEKHPGERLGS